jgi:membrane associated rhomboid family serine protease
MGRMVQRRIASPEVIVIALVTLGVFFHQESLMPLRRMLFDDQYGAVPEQMWAAWRTFREAGFSRELLPSALPLLTANYLHADIGHVGGNLLFFWIFAHVLSRTIGRTLLVLTYLFAGAIAVLVYVHTNPTSEVPMLGASGAIAGLEGAYFTLVLRWELPHASIWPFQGDIPPGRLAFLAIMNFVLDTGAFVGHARDHVAYGAHVGGFLGGAFVAMVLSTVSRPEWRDA